MEASISVIIPVYNNQRYLSQCLDSVLTGQEDVIKEIIVVDDGSTDDTPVIARAYAETDPRIRVIYQQNRCCGGARNTGIEASTGEYIAFVDADDMLMPGALPHLLSLMGPSVDIAIGRYFRDASMSPHYAADHSERHTVIGAELANKIMLYRTGFISSPWGRLYRRSAIGDIRFKENLYYEDLDFNYRLFHRVNQVALTHRTLYLYRRNPDSAMSLWDEKRLDVLRVTEWIEADAASRNNPSLLAAARDRRLSACFNMYALCCNHQRHTMANLCWTEIRRLRRATIANGSVRWRNRAAAAVSYLGPTVLRLLGHAFYRLN